MDKWDLTTGQLIVGPPGGAVRSYFLSDCAKNLSASISNPEPLGELARYLGSDLQKALAPKPEQLAITGVLHVAGGSRVFGESQMLSGWDFELGTHVEIFFEHGGVTITLEAEFEQVHVDLLLEGEDSLYLGFVCRQDSIPLIQAFRALTQVSNSSPKAVGAFFLIEETDHWLLVLVDFEAEDDLTSLRALSAHKLDKSAHLGQAKQEDLAPFPQANSVPRIVEMLIFLAGETPLSADDVATHLGLSYRQALYYLNALRYLGLCSRNSSPNGGWQIDRETKTNLMTSPPGSVVRDAIGRCTELVSLFGVLSAFGADQLISHLSDGHPELSDVTIARRVQTVVAWYEWFSDNRW